MFHKLIFKVNTLFNIVLFLPNVIKIYLSKTSNSHIQFLLKFIFSFFSIIFHFVGGGLTDFFVINISPIFFFKLLDSMSLILRKNERGEIASLMK